MSAPVSSSVDPSGEILYSTEVPNSKNQEKGLGPIRRTGTSLPPVLAVPDAKNSGAMLYTAYENFLAACDNFKDNRCLGWRPIDKEGNAGDYRWMSYGQVRSSVFALAAGLRHLELCPALEDPELNNLGKIGLFSKNRPEWVLLELAAHCHSIVPVPMYDTLDAEGVAYVVKQVGLVSLACSSETAPRAIESKKSCPSLKNLILMDKGGATAELRTAAKAEGLSLLTIEDLISTGNQLGEKTPPHSPPSPQDIYTFCYTSGTTGEPKGAMISHENLLSNIAAATALILPVCSSDVHLSYLPLPHMLERVVQFYLLWGGAAIGFFQGDPLKIVEDIQALRPTLFPSVPRLLNRIKDKVTAQIYQEGGMKQRLYEMAFNSKLSGLKQGYLTHLLWDSLLFGKIKQKVGLDRLRYLITGSAPLSGDTMDWLRVVFGVPVQEGYGQTESTLIISMQYPDDLTSLNVGAPIPCCEIRLVDVPEMNYLMTDTEHASSGKSGVRLACKGRGEIWVRGPNVFKGYYAMPEKTKETITEDGWLQTGDIGLWTVDGKLKIIDRKKNIFKLAQGEYVAAEKIENVLGQSPFLMQVFVYGDSYKTQLVCVGVLDPDYVPQWADKQGFKGVSLEALSKDSKVQAAVLRDLTSRSAENKLMGFEIVKALHLESVQWTPADLLTPTFKLKRNVAQAKYEKEIEEMYEQLEKGASKL